MDDIAPRLREASILSLTFADTLSSFKYFIVILFFISFSPSSALNLQ